MTYKGRRSPREARKPVAPGREDQLEMRQHLVGERGVIARIIARFATICADLSIAKAVVLGAVSWSIWFIADLGSQIANDDHFPYGRWQMAGSIYAVRSTSSQFMS